MTYGANGRTLQKKYGLSYFLATLFFPEPLRSDVFAVYGFVREADDLVDNTSSQEQRVISLAHFQENYQKALRGELVQSASINDFVTLKQSKGILDEYVDSFFSAMSQDTKDTRYQSYQELEHYMYGSATVIGFIMCELIGYQSGALPYAKKLAEAMQLTNFLRDIREDWSQYNRVYIPEEDFKRFDLTHHKLEEVFSTPVSRLLIKDLVERAEQLYRESEPGIAMLDKRGRKAVYIASRLYEGILTEIKRHDYDPWNHDCHTSKLTKISIILKNICLPKKLSS
jgi:15-cis-phytoene synthase